jgi:hypothetical protein
MENSCGQSQFISWPALATFTEGIKRQWKMLRDLSVHVGKGWKYQRRKPLTFGSILLVGKCRNRAIVSTWKCDKHGSCLLPYHSPDVPGLGYTVYGARPCPPPVFVGFITLWLDPSLFYNSALPQFCTITFLANIMFYPNDQQDVARSVTSKA